MNAFVDCGAFRGKALGWARKKYPGYKLYAFECNPKLSKEYGNDVISYSKACWINNGQLRFYMNLKHPTIEGHSVYKNKTTGNLDREHPVIVECIDFSSWLMNNFNANDNIIVKMNIEGAEYDVLEHCLDIGSIKIIKELYIQWHHKKIPGFENRHSNLMTRLNKVESLKVFHGYGSLRVK